MALMWLLIIQFIYSSTACDVDIIFFAIIKYYIYNVFIAAFEWAYF